MQSAAALAPDLPERRLSRGRRAPWSIMYRFVGHLFFASLVAVACDPEHTPAVAGAEKAPARVVPAPTDDVGAHSTPAAPPASAPVPPASAPEPPVSVAREPGEFARCLLRCDAAKLDHAEKAACRYNCEGPTAPEPGADAGPGAAIDSDPVATVVRCMSRCSGKDARACRDTCKAAVPISPATPAPMVLDELAVCMGDCHAESTASATNRATCELNCADLARVAGPALGTVPAPNLR